MLRDENQHRDEYGKRNSQSGSPDTAAPRREILSMIVAGHLTIIPGKPALAGPEG